LFVLEDAHDLLVGRAVRQRRGRWPFEAQIGRHRADCRGRGRQCFAVGLRLARARAQVVDLLDQVAFALLDAVQGLLDDGVGPSHRPPPGGRGSQPAQYPPC
jgi:hypothetical protein